MPISLPVPHDTEKNLYQLLAEILRRAVDGSIPYPYGLGPILTAPNGSKWRLGVDNDGALNTTGPL